MENHAPLADDDVPGRLLLCSRPSPRGAAGASQTVEEVQDVRGYEEPQPSVTTVVLEEHTC